MRADALPDTRTAGAESPSVLIGFAESEAAPEVAWSLADAGARVHVFARRGEKAALRHSRYVTWHEVEAPERDVAAALTEIRIVMSRVLAAATNRPAVFFPLDDASLWLGKEITPEAPWIVAGPLGCRAELALNKWRQVRLALDCGLNVPASVLVQSRSDLATVRDAVGLPLILKSADCFTVSGRRRVARRNWICATEQELAHAVERWDGTSVLLAQRFIPGVGEGVFGIVGDDGVRAWSGHKRLRMMNPHGSGSSACVSRDVSGEEKERIAAFLGRAAWRGLFMVELLRDRDGKVWFIEFNGRPWGSMALARRQGLEYPAWHVSLALDAHSAAGIGSTSQPGIVCRNVGRELMHLAFVLRGPQSTAPLDWPSLWDSVRSMARIGAVDGVYNWRRSDWRVFLADVSATLLKNVAKSRPAA